MVLIEAVREYIRNQNKTILSPSGSQALVPPVCRPHFAAEPSPERGAPAPKRWAANSIGNETTQSCLLCTCMHSDHGCKHAQAHTRYSPPKYTTSAVYWLQQNRRNWAKRWNTGVEEGTRRCQCDTQQRRDGIIPRMDIIPHKGQDTTDTMAFCSLVSPRQDSNSLPFLE